MKPKYPSPEEKRNALNMLRAGQSLSAVQKATGICQKTLFRWRKDAGFAPGNKVVSEKTREEVVRLCRNSKMSHPMIARKLGVSLTSIAKYLREDREQSANSVREQSARESEEELARRKRWQEAAEKYANAVSDHPKLYRPAGVRLIDTSKPQEFRPRVLTPEELKQIKECLRR